jgi:3-oxoacyl-(acyl-carrier-protein) synthase/NAD(P)-dependent dehydrogenase (short-subunit alcohol dehydrogenase family)
MPMDIAIIGMAGKFPEANTIGEFYKNLREGRDSIRQISNHRKRATSLSLTEPYRILGFIEDIDLFDHDFFGISFGEAVHMDPHQRMMMEVVYHLFENAGYSLEAISGANIGLYCGYSSLKYYEHAESFDPTLPTGNATSTIARRIARFFNLTGPGVMIDTGCSSSLVALHYACVELMQHNIDSAIVAGARVVLFPKSDSDELTKLGTSSRDGKTRTFSDDADGTGSGEAFGAILLKPLSKAVEDNDIVHAVIKGTAVNQDAARSGSLTAPSAAAQEELLKKTWKAAGIDPRCIGYIEAHGTGTKLGDPIEIQGITKAYSHYQYPKQFCAISSVKSNIGHTDSAAGISGVIKAVLALKHKELFPSVNFRAPSPFIDFENSPVFVNTMLKDWKTNEEPRLAGVSSFAMSGTNAHVILQEPPGTLQPKFINPSDNEYHVITVSARTVGSLRDNLTELHNHLLQHPEISLHDLSYSLATGRTHFIERISVIAKTRIEALDGIKGLIEAMQSKDQALKDRNPGEVVLIFSGNCTEQIKSVGQFLMSFAAFTDAYERIRRYCSEETLLNQNIQILIFEYAFCHWVRDLGIESNILIGNGIGQITAGIISGKLSLSEGIDHALIRPKEEGLNDLVPRTEKLLSRFEGRQVTFFEIGINGQLPSYMASLNKSSQFSVVPSKYAINNEYWYSSFLANAYQALLRIDWNKAFAPKKGRKLELPPYRFEPNRCWIRPMGEDVRKQELYTTRWLKEDIVFPVLSIQDQCVLLFHDDSGFGELIAQKLKMSNIVFSVRHAPSFNVVAREEIQMDFSSEVHCRQLADLLRTNNFHLTAIVHLPNFVTAHQHNPNEVTHQHQKLYSLYFIAKAFNEYLTKKNFKMSVITTDSHIVTERDRQVSPSARATEGFVKGLLSEYRTLDACVIDFPSDVVADEAATFFLHCFASDLGIKFFAYRDKAKYVLQLTRHAAKLNEASEQPQFDNTDAFIVTGGATGIGKEIGKSIAQKCRGTVIVLGRTKLPPMNQWHLVEPNNKPVYEKVKSLIDIQDAGAKVLYYCVDLSDEVRMQEVFVDIRQRIGKLKGVVHCAGVVMSLTPMRDLAFTDFTSVIHPKIDGTVLLEKYARPFYPDFFVTFSSLNSLVPRPNSSEYAAACSFQNAFAVNKAMTTGKSFISISWPGWRDIKSSTARATLSKGNDTEAGVQPIGNEEGIKLFYASIQLGIPNPIIASVDLDSFAVNPFFLTDKAVSLDKQNPSSVSTDKRSTTSLDLEDVVKSAWESVLQIKVLSLNDDFFALGGHSLNAINVVNYLEKTLAIRVDLDSLLNYPTISLQANYLRGLIEKNETPREINLIAIEEQEHYELSPSQRQLWVTNLTSVNKEVYNLSTQFKIRGNLNVLWLEHAFKRLINRHEILRTIIIEQGGGARQKILQRVSNYKIPYTNLSDDDSRQNKYMQIVEKDRLAAVDLTMPMFRTELIKFPDCHYLLFTIHHICCDFFSMNTLMEELLQNYQHAANSRMRTREELKLQYKDFAVWQNRMVAQKEVLESHRSYWSTKFAGGAPLLSIVTDYERPAKRTNNGGRVTLQLAPSCVSFMDSIAAQLNTSTFTIALASLKILLYKYTQQSALVIGGAYGARPFEELNNQIGYYIRTLPFYTVLDPSSNFTETVLNVKKTATEAFVHSIYSIDQIVADLRLSPTSGRNQLFDVMIDLLDTRTSRRSHEKTTGPAELEVDVLPRQSFFSKYDLTFYFKLFPGSFTLDIEYSADLFTGETISLLGNNYLQLLSAIISRPDISVNSLDFSNQDEQHLFDSFNNTDIHYSFN